VTVPTNGVSNKHYYWGTFAKYLPGNSDRIPTTHVLGHQTHHMLMTVHIHAHHLSAFQAETSSGKATTSLHYTSKQARKWMYNVILRSVLGTIVAVGKNKYYIL